MEDNYAISLPHLTSDIVSGVRKTKLCAYAVALEGWRRGLKLKWYTIDSDKFQDMITFGVNPPGRLFSLSTEDRTHYFFRTRGDKVTNEAVEIGSDKEDTKTWLGKAGVPVPEGREFPEEAPDEEIVEYGASIGFPVVIKPTNGSLGNGVITNIKNETALKKAIVYVRQRLEYPEVIVERYVPGEEYRVYVVEDQVIAAYNRVPANITGDGTHTIAELIELKNEFRKKNPRLFSCLIEVDEEVFEFIEEAGCRMDDVPEKGQRLLLKEKTNVSSGGDPIDVTDTMDPRIKEIAINAIKAVPGLYHGGVDIIVNPNEPPERGAIVIELNPTAQIGGILFPVQGHARDIPGAIIDFYFPETKGMNTKESNVYFDFNTVLEPLQSRSSVEVEVAPAPEGRLYAKKYTLSGKVQRHSYHEWLRKQAHDQDLHGYIRNLANGDIEVLIAGSSREAVSRFKTMFGKSAKAEIKKVQEETWKGPVKIGFEITEQFSTSNLRSVENGLKKMEKELRKTEKEMRKLERENRKIQQSRSWKMTTPVRRVGALMKR